jgi:hypothetical protein
MELDLGTGDVVANAPVDLTGAALCTASDFSVVVRSNLVTIALGTATSVGTLSVRGLMPVGLVGGGAQTRRPRLLVATNVAWCQLCAPRSAA